MVHSVQRLRSKLLRTAKTLQNAQQLEDACMILRYNGYINEDIAAKVQEDVKCMTEKSIESLNEVLA